MPRGGARAGAGRKADPNSRRQKALVAKAAKAASGAPRPRKSLGRGLTLPDGCKSPDAPADWPFGKAPLETPPPAQGEPKLSFGTPLEYWEHVLADPTASKSDKHAAAYSMAPYVHAKIAPAAKKEEAKSKSKTASTGRFGSSPPPKLAASGGKRV